MMLESVDIAPIGAAPRGRHRRAAAPALARRERAPLRERWHALMRAIHEIACLPALGGCPEELIDTRESGERTIADG